MSTNQNCEMWSENRISEIFETASGGTPKSTNPLYYKDGKIAWINSGELNSPYIRSAKHFITENGVLASSLKTLPVNSVLVAMYGGGTVGKTSLLKIEACVNQAICGILPHPGYVPLFVKYALDNIYSYLIGLSTGSARDNLSQKGVGDIKLRFPSYETQKQIATTLGSLDEKIEVNRQKIVALERLVRLVYEYWFHQFDFPGIENKPYRSSGGKMVWNEQLKRKIPEGWKTGSLYEIADFINGVACQKFPPKDGEPVLPVVKIREMQEGVTDSTEYVSEKTPFKNRITAGDILFSWSATLKTMLWTGGDAGLNQHIFKVIPINGFPKSYVYQQLSDYIGIFVKLAETRKTTMGHITAEHIQQSRILLPPEDICIRFETFATPMYEELLVLSKSLNLLTEIRDWLLPMLMNGQVVVVDPQRSESKVKRRKNGKRT